MNVRGDLFAPNTIAPSGASHEHPVLVCESEAETVDLQLRDVVHVLDGFATGGKAAAYAGVELTQLLFRIRVIEAEHRFGVFDGDKSRRRSAADALRWGIRGNEIRILPFETLELAHQGV